MTSKATYAACEWIKANHPLQPRYILSGAIDTDKKHSAMNMIQTRGKRVIAEFTLKREVAHELLRVEPANPTATGRSPPGAFQAGSAYSARTRHGLAAMYIATGQDAANVAESHGGITYGQLLDNGDYYWSVTLPAVICATHGGGTNRRPSGNAWSCWAATAPARRTSWRRSSRPWCWRGRIPDLGDPGRRLGQQPRGARNR